MSPEFERPIVVTGMGRSGSTFTQHLLHTHPDILAGGQPPPCGTASLTWFGNVQKRLESAARNAKASNADLKYAAPHYMGIDPPAVSGIVRELYASFCHGDTDQRRRPAYKMLQILSDNDGLSRWLDWFPDTQFIVCIRDPFLSAESMRRLYTPQLEIEEFLSRFVSQVNRADSVDALLFAIDRTTTPDDQSQMGQTIREWLGLAYSSDWNEFVSSWPPVHRSNKAIEVSADFRQAACAKIEGLHEALQRFNYV